MPRRLAILLLLVGWFAASRPTAQVRPMYDLGAAGLVQQLEQLRTTASVLHTGAHPDDEDSGFLARTARGDHARVAYLSLTRGEGGQNILGPELFDALGVIRTEELLQARRLDGASQYFTRAFDFGFTKTRAEAAAKWDEHEVLGDIVRVIRTFHPLVVYSRFSGTPADGHGQHQLAGYLTPKAVEAAADPTQFPEQLAEGLHPWRARKVYRGTGFRSDPNEGSVTVETGVLDPVLGRTYAEIAAQGRSEHKSQQMGSIEPLGPSATGLLRIGGPQGAGPEQSIFDGLDVGVRGLAALAGLPAGSLVRELDAVAAAADAALAQFDPREPARLVPILGEGLRATRRAREVMARLNADATARADADFVLAIKEREFSEALARAAGITLDPLAGGETVVQGGAIDVAARVFARTPAQLVFSRTELLLPPGWTFESIAPGGIVSGGWGRSETPAASAGFRAHVPADAPLTEPYYLLDPRPGDRYQWPAGSAKALPFGPAVLRVAYTLEIGGTPLTLTRDVQYRYADGIRGELRRNVAVVPAVALSVDSPLLIVPSGGTAKAQTVVVQASSFNPAPMSGTLALQAPAGWAVTPATAPFTVKGPGEVATARFTVTPPTRRADGRFGIEARAHVGTRAFTRHLEVIAYPHIQTHRLYADAAVTAEVFDLQVASVRVGYIMGSGDQVPEALERMGVTVTRIGPELLATGDLSRFDTIVVGIRASETRPDFVAGAGRLRQFMERGGTLIVQYQQRDYAQRELPPFPVSSAGSRVTDETAPVRILAPDNPVFTFPNRITDADFAGWVQERNLYAFDTFDARYTPLLESADPGEGPQRGGEVYARVGQGHYVYTAYAWFRQLPAGVPGAYRQFANLISLPKAPRSAGSPGAGAAVRSGAAVAPAPARTRRSR